MKSFLVYTPETYHGGNARSFTKDCRTSRSLFNGVVPKFMEKTNVDSGFVCNGRLLFLFFSNIMVEERFLKITILVDLEFRYSTMK
jgi:hypothetical protein